MSLINLQHFTSIDRWKGLVSKKAVFPHKPSGIPEAAANPLIASPVSLKAVGFTNYSDFYWLMSQLDNKSTKEPLEMWFNDALKIGGLHENLRVVGNRC